MFLYDPSSCDQLLARPSHTVDVPSVRIQLNGLDLIATRHHIIPFDTLKRFFNLAVELSLRNQGLFSDYINEVIRGITRQFRDAPGMGYVQRPPTSYFNGPLTVEVEANERMQAALTWLPGNIFYGPSPGLRSDDPRDGFETGSRRIVGDSIYNLLQDINTDMNNFLREERYQTEATFRTILFRIRRLLEFRNHPFAFDPNDWIITSRGLFAIHNPSRGNNGGNHVAHDELRRRRRRQATSEEQKYNYEAYNGLYEFCAVASDNVKKCYSEAI